MDAVGLDGGCRLGSQDSVWELVVIGARQVYLLWDPGQVGGAFRILGLRMRLSGFILSTTQTRYGDVYL